MKRLTALTLAVLCVCSVNSYADTKADIARCAALGSPAERLSCYDNVASTLGVSGGKTITTPQTKGRGKWEVRAEASPIDDSKNVYVQLQANEEVKAGHNTARPTLIVRCKENRTQLFVVWDLYLGMGETEVLSRLDSGTATRSSWSISTDYKATFCDGSDIEYLRNLMEHDKLLLQVTPYGESPVMVTFNLAGLAEAIKPLQEACKWK